MPADRASRGTGPCGSQRTGAVALTDEDDAASYGVIDEILRRRL